MVTNALDCYQRPRHIKHTAAKLLGFKVHPGTKGHSTF